MASSPSPNSIVVEDLREHSRESSHGYDEHEHGGSQQPVPIEDELSEISRTQTTQLSNPLVTCSKQTSAMLNGDPIHPGMAQPKTFTRPISSGYDTIHSPFTFAPVNHRPIITRKPMANTTITAILSENKAKTSFQLTSVDSSVNNLKCNQKSISAEDEGRSGGNREKSVADANGRILRQEDSPNQTTVTVEEGTQDNAQLLRETEEMATSVQHGTMPKTASPIFDPLPNNELATALSPVASNTVDTTHEIRTEHETTHRASACSPSSRSSARFTPDLSARSITILGSKHLQSRIQKPEHRHGPKRAIVAEAKPFSSTSNQNGPSEEDLIYLLYYRSRTREAIEAEKQKTITNLYLENGQLLEQNEEYRVKLDQALADEAYASEQRDLGRQKLEDFKMKYNKIKNWAREINKDYGSLREEADKLKARLQNLTDEDHNMRSNIASLDSITSRVIVDNDKHKLEISSMRSSSSKLAISLAKAEDELKNKRKQVHELQQRTQKFESHIASLETRQGIYDKASQERNENISTSLLQLSHQLKRLQSSADTGTPVLENVNKSLVLIQAIYERSTVTKSDLQMVQGSVQTFRAELVKGIMDLEKSLQTTGATFQEASNPAIMLEIKEIVNNLRPDLEQVQKATKDLAVLEERVRGKQDTIQSLKETLPNAKTFATDLRKATELFSKASQPEERIFTQTMKRLEDDLGILHIKLHNASSELAKAKIEAEEATEKHESLSANLAKVTIELEQERVDRSSAEQISQNLKADIEAGLIQCKKDKDEMAVKHGQRLEALEYEVQQHLQNNQNLTKEHETLLASKAAVDQEVETMRQEIKTITEEKQSLERKFSDLAGKLDETQLRMAEIPKMHETIQILTSESESFKAFQADYDQLQESLKSNLCNISGKDEEIIRLQTQLEKHCAILEEIKSVSCELQESNKQVEDLKEKLNQSKKTEAFHVDLQGQLKEAKAKVLSLEADLSISRQSEVQLDIICKENHDLIERNGRLEQELESMMILFEKNKALDEVNQEKDVVITQQKDLLAAKEIEITSLKTASEIPLEEMSDTDGTALEMRIESPLTLRSLIHKDDTETQNNSQQHTINQQQTKASSSGKSNGNDAQSQQSGPESNETAVVNRPERRIADRSGSNKSVARFQPPYVVFQEQSAEIDTSPQLGRSRSIQKIEESQRKDDADLIIPETQLDVVTPLQQSRFIELTSPLSELSSICTLSSQDLYDDNVSESIENRHVALSDKVKIQKPRLQQRGSGEEQDINKRPPSSALSEDLFKQHASRLQVNGETIFEIRSSKTATRFASMSDRDASRRSQITPPAPEQRFDPTLRPAGSQHHSPNARTEQALRNEHHVAREPTPVGNPRVSSESGVTIPTMSRDKHQPNSAAKRKVEIDPIVSSSQESSKRLKRRPANMTIKPQQGRSSVRSKEVSPIRTGFSNGARQGTVIGTNAPVPGKSKRGSQFVRKNSRKDKYERQFNQDA